MRLLEVGNNHRRNIRELAQDSVRTWEKERITRWERDWLEKLSMDDPLVQKLFQQSQKFNQYGGEANEQILPAAYDFARAYNILAKLKRREDFDNFVSAPAQTGTVTEYGTDQNGSF